MHSQALETANGLSALIVEDDPLFQLLIRKELLSLYPDVSAHLFARGQDALTYLEDKPKIDLALMDLGLPDVDGVEIIRQLHRSDPEIPIVVMSISTEEERVLKAVRAGAMGYLVKGDTTLPLARAIEQALSGVHPISPRLAGYFLRQAGMGRAASLEDHPSLTRRERELLRYFAEGLSYNEAAAQMNVALTTIQTHSRKLYRKLNVSSGLQAVAKAKDLGLL